MPTPVSTEGSGTAKVAQEHYRNIGGNKLFCFALPNLSAFDVYLYALLYRRRACSVYNYTMNSGDIIKALGQDGWARVGQKGSHVQFKHPTKPGRATVPHPKKDVPIGTLRSIEKQSGLKLR